MVHEEDINRQTPEATARLMSRPTLLLLLVATIIVSLLVFSQTSLNLSFFDSQGKLGTFVLVGLSALIFLLFVTLSFVLLRNLFKLFAERKMGVLGSAFRTRMVIGGLVLSFLPVIFMFAFSYLLMNHSIDKWFSRPVEELREDSAQVAGLLSTYAADNAHAEAMTLSQGRTIAHAFESGDFSGVSGVLLRTQANLQGGFSLVLDHDYLKGSQGLPASWAELSPLLLPLADHYIKSTLQVSGATIAHSNAFPMDWNGRQYLVAVQEMPPAGKIMVGLPLPPSLTGTLNRIDANQKKYFNLSTERRQIRRFYMQLLLLITVLVLFAATWLSLFMGRLVTRPVAALAEATKEISEGNLEYRVQVSAADELGELIKSFNAMASELENNRREIDQSRRELSSTNVALSSANTDIEQRRRQIETILENIPTGVLSLNADRTVSHSNKAFKAMFRSLGSDPIATLRSIFDSSIVVEVEHLLRRADRMGAASREMRIQGQRGGELSVEVTIASLHHENKHLGYVIVFEDLSELLKAQKQVAWREVARRVAHEIKNPLTPIALSAERIKKHLDRLSRGTVPDSNSLSVIESCSATISSAVETMRTLVDDFATLARFPTAQPQPADINQIVSSALAMFNGRLEGVQLQTDLATDLPLVMADAESIKRVVANLVDNAAEAIHESMFREIQISTALVDDETRDMVEINVTDSGHGVSRELREKLFMPYFSTKERGTGLGLAIVSRIVEEHHGSVRVEENAPVGARFVVELPVAPPNGKGKS